MEIAGFGDLNFILFFVVLSELIVKCVIGFGRFCENVRESMEMVGPWKELVFSMLGRIGLCV